MAKRGSLHYQAKSTLAAMEGFGRSRHADKQAGTDKHFIYSRDTMKTYQHQCGRFIAWVKENCGGVRTLEQAREHVDDYLTHIIGAGWKPASVATSASALAKLYQCSKGDFRPTPPVTRASITRSREKGEYVPDAKMVAVTRTFVLRKCVLKELRPEMLGRDERGYYIAIPAKIDKHGKPHTVYAHAPRTDEGRVRLELAAQTIREALPGNRVFRDWDSRYYSHADRAFGCWERYTEYTREVMERNGGEIPEHDRYVMRNSYDADGISDGLGGTVLSRSALRQCGVDLSHGPFREHLIANHYLYNRG